MQVSINFLPRGHAVMLAPVVEKTFLSIYFLDTFVKNQFVMYVQAFLDSVLAQPNRETCKVLLQALYASRNFLVAVTSSWRVKGLNNPGFS